MSDPVRLLLMYFVVPLWLVAGVGDWACHRKTGIESNAGPKESLLHLLMLGELGFPMLMAVFLEINATVICAMLFALVVHEITAWWDAHYAATCRYISTFEQHMHALLEVLPLTAFLLVLVKHWSQFLALLGLGENVTRHGLQWKLDALPAWYVIALMVAVLLFAVLPYVEELIRGIRWQRQVRRWHRPRTGIRVR